MKENNLTRSCWEIGIIDEKQFGDWHFRLGSERKLSPCLKSRLEDILSSDFAQAYQPRYPYFFVEDTGYPSPIVRVDFSPEVADKNVLVSIYEIEARPAGLGIICSEFGMTEPFMFLINQLTKAYNKQIGAKVLPSLVGNEQKKDRRRDTQIFAEIMNLPYFDFDQEPSTTDFLLWIRGGKDDEEILNETQLEKMALAPVRDHGNKRYLLKMGLAQLLSSNQEINWHEPFCVKPLFGSKSDRICLWDPKNKEAHGISTKTRIEKIVAQSKDDELIIQPFIAPEPVVVNQLIYNLIYRVFAVLNLETKKYEIVGGLYTARPNFIVHGASDAVLGLVKNEV